MRIHRLVAILLLLESRGVVKARELAGALEVSERTVYRDIDTLCEAGVPIASSAGPSGGFYLMEGYAVNNNYLDCDDVVNLYLSGMGVHPYHNSESSVRLKKSLARLEHSVANEYRPDIEKARKSFYFDPSLWWKERVNVQHAEVLRRAVWHSQKLLITYTRASRHQVQTTERVVHPYGLVVKAFEWYLICFCELRGEMRVFKCDRISEASLLDETFKTPDNFVLEEFWRNQVVQFIDAVTEP